MNAEAFRSYCLSFPGATEEVQWGADLLFKVGGKTFVFSGLEGTSVSVKCGEERFRELLEDERFSASKYLARYFWVSVDHATLSDKETKRLVTDSYEDIVRRLPKSKRP